MKQLSPEEIEVLEKQAREAFRPKPQAIWRTIVVVVFYLGAGYSLIWGNAIFGSVLFVAATFLRWLFSRTDS